MAAFCHFWRYTPEQYWNLTVAEYSAMVDYMADLAEKGS